MQKIAREPSRALDALIATATFPALPEHRCGTNGVWIQEDGPRVRALRYSDSYKAAATLTLPGHWIEAHDTGYMIVGPDGEWCGTHEGDTLALCLAALRARFAELGRKTTD